jgi:hypothetical protein
MSRRLAKILSFFLTVLLIVLWRGARPQTTHSEHHGDALRSSPQQRTVLLRERENRTRQKIWEGRVDAGRKTWARVFDSGGNDVANCVKQTRDGGYIIAGSRFFGSDVWIIKLFPDGKIQWQRAYGRDGPDEASTIQETPDGGFIVAGYTTPGFLSSEDRDYLVLKLDPWGNIEWQRAYGDISTDDWATSLSQTDDGGYVVAGVSELLDGGYSDYWILRLEASGDIMWQRRYGGPGSDEAKSIVSTADGGFIVAGYSWPFGGDYSGILLLKLAGDGDIEWQKLYSELRNEWTASIQQTIDGGYIVSGYSASSEPEIGAARVIKLFASGDIQWQRLYRPSGGGEARCVKQTREGDYIVAGSAYYPDEEGGGQDAWILRLTAAGEVEWQRTYGGFSFDRASAIEQTDDGGFIASGETYSQFGPTGLDSLILRIDRDGLIDKVPEFTRTSQIEVMETFVVPRATSVLSQKTSLKPQLTDLVSQETNAADRLLFSPPLNFSGEVVTNRSLSQLEYVHVLRWEDNPNNDDLRVTKYRIYIPTFPTLLLAEVDAHTLRYEVRNIWPGSRTTYAVVGVTSDNEEGLAAILTLEPTGKAR